MGNLIDFESYPVRPMLPQLLQDKTSRENIIFATNSYKNKGEEFSERSQITPEKILGMHKIAILPRVEKSTADKTARKKKKAEVFTPSWIVNKMNNHCDEAWLGYSGAFNTEVENSWITNHTAVRFDKKRTWQKYVDSRRIEITCGEAPFVASRYDAATGEIIPIEDRMGFLDRKLRVVNENAADDDEWKKWTERAFQSSYGYEFQGDSLLIARINLLLTYVEHYERHFGSPPKIEELYRIVDVICWNIWQMDGLTGLIPYGGPIKIDDAQMIMDGYIGEIREIENIYCKIHDWRAKETMPFIALGK